MAATRGGDLWWDYRWRYFFITVSPGRLALFSSSSYSGRPLYSLRRRSRRAAAGPSRFSPQEAPPASSTLPISPYASVTCTPPRSRSARGGLYLNNIHELRYTRQIYCPGTRGFCEDLRTEPSLRPYPRAPPFFRSLALRASPSSFFSSSGSPSGFLARDFALLIDEHNLPATLQL